jgi:hypothetical protein
MLTINLYLGVPNQPSTGYDALLDCLTHIRNPEACFLSRMDTCSGKTTAPSHPSPSSRRRCRSGTVAAYVAAMVLYRANGGAVDDDTARWYIRQVEAEEVSAAATAMIMRTNKGCLRCCEAASEVIQRVTWRRRATLAPPVAHDNHQCAGGLCFKMRWENGRLFVTRNVEFMPNVIYSLAK